MFTRTWSTSPRAYEMTVERNVKAPMGDGTLLDGDVFRPDGPGRFPVILGISPYDKSLQSPPMMPVGFSPIRGYMESGDPSFFVRRGYVHAIFNVRGCGGSDGLFQFSGKTDARDTSELVEWLARQPWADGTVGIFGVSFFAKLGMLAAIAGTPSLKAIFAPFACNDWYRDVWYHGGILNARFMSHWRFSPHNLRHQSLAREELGEAGYLDAIEELKGDPDIVALPALREALDAPEAPRNAILVDFLIHSLDGPFWRERDPGGEACDVPAYLGACWGNYALHLPGAFRAWKQWRGPKKLVIGPGVYLDRPLYQYQAEALRWFDYWLKGMETGIMDEAPVRCFIPPQGEWRELEDWPPPEARWTDFFLHAGGILSEHELWPGEGVDSFNESPFGHESLTYATPPLVEPTEILGPSILTLYASTTDTEALLFVTLLLIDGDGAEHELTRGWLRASQRKLDQARTQRWEPVLAHDERESLTPGEIYELQIPIVATARTVGIGERIALRIKGADDEPQATSLEGLARAHLQRRQPARITIHHGERHASCLRLPVTRGNVMGTYFSGGDISSFQVVG